MERNQDGSVVDSSLGTKEVPPAKIFTDTSNVGWDSFVKSLSASRASPPNGVQLALLRSVLTAYAQNNVGVEQSWWAWFTSIFGDPNSETFFSHFEIVITALNFCGFLDSAGAMNLLRGRSPGTWVLRFSSTSADSGAEGKSGCLTVSYVKNDKFIEHARLTRSAADGKYCLLAKIYGDTIPQVLEAWQAYKKSIGNPTASVFIGANPFDVIVLRERHPPVIPPNIYKEKEVPKSDSYDVWNFPSELIAPLFGGAVSVSFAMRTLRFVSRRWNIMVMTRLPLSYTPAFGVTGDEVENVLLRFRNIVKLDISAVVRFSKRALLAVNWSVLQSLTVSSESLQVELPSLLDAASLLATRTKNFLCIGKPPVLSIYSTRAIELPDLSYAVAVAPKQVAVSALEHSSASELHRLTTQYAQRLCKEEPSCSSDDLRSLTISGKQADSFLSLLEPHLPQLRHLSLHYACFAQFFNALPVTLLSLVITADEPVSPQEKPIELSFERLSYLEELRIEGSALDIIDAITTPSSLRTLYASSLCKISFKSVSNLRNLHIHYQGRGRSTTGMATVLDLMYVAPVRLASIFYRSRIICQQYFATIPKCPSIQVLILTATEAETFPVAKVQRILNSFPQLRLLISSNLTLNMPPVDKSAWSLFAPLPVVRAVANPLK